MHKVEDDECEGDDDDGDYEEDVLEDSDQMTAGEVT